MNRDEGAITELFSFDTPEKFTDFLVDLVVDPSLPTEVRKNLEQQARTIAQRPARELEKRFLSTAVLRLRPVRDAALATATNARELMKISAAIDLAREHLLARAATRDADAGLADTAVGEAQRKANEDIAAATAACAARRRWRGRQPAHHRRSRTTPQDR